MSLLLGIWFLGCIVRTISFVRGVAATRRILKGCVSSSEGVLHDVYEDALAALGSRVRPRLLESPEVSSPLVIGVLRPVIALPSEIESELDRDQLEGVLRHEIAHVLRRDNLVGMIQRLFSILWWPHPLVHFLNRQLNQTREEICDNYAMIVNGNHSYVKALLQLATRQRRTEPLISTVGLLHSKWRLEDRIRGLLDQQRNYAVRFGLGRTLIVLGVMGTAMFLIAGAKVTPLSQEEAIELIRSHGGAVTGLNGGSEGTERVMVMQNWTGTTETLRQLKYISGIKEIWFSGTTFDEIVVEDLPDLERIIFNVNFYDNSINEQVIWNGLPVQKVRLKNLPKIKAFNRRGGGNNLTDTLVTNLELVEMDQLTELHVEGLQLGDGMMQSLPGAPNLTSIQLGRPHSTRTGGRTEITDAGLESLADLRELTSLGLEGSRVTNEGLKTIGKLTSLHGLGLTATDIDDDGLGHIAGLTELGGLGVGETGVTDRGLQQIVAQHPNLKSISIAGSKITADGLRALQGLSKLNVVELDSSQLTEESCAVLSTLPITMIQVNGSSDVAGHLSGLSEVKTLFIGGTQNLTMAEGSLAGLKSLYIRGAGIDATRSLFERFADFSELEMLEVSNGWDNAGQADVRSVVHVNDELMQHISHLQSLKFLWMSTDELDIGDSGFAALAPLTSLEGLLLPQTNVTDTGVQHLSGLVNLTRLTLSGDRITNESLVHFENLKNLRELYLNNTRVDQQAAMRLKANLPDATIQAYRVTPPTRIDVTK